jgi:hypothetical protein
MPDIDPREFGRLEAEVQSLCGQVTSLQRDVKSLLELAHKSKGGLWVGMSVVSILSGAFTLFVERIFKP